MQTKVGKAVDLKSTKQTNQELSTAIMTAVDVKSTFDLYAYRCISPDQFVERIKELCEFNLKN